MPEAASRFAGGVVKRVAAATWRIEAALAELATDTSGVVVTQRGDIVDLRMELSSDTSPDEPMAEWMLQISGARSARLGVDAAGALYAIAAIPARPVSTGALAWALGEVRGQAMYYVTAALPD